MAIEFKPIDLSQNADTCVRFREDSFTASFGDPARFHEADGQGASRYLDWLKNKILRDPRGCVHIWKDGVIVGQIEMGPLKADPSVLNVNLFYLSPAARGSGLGDQLQGYVEEYMRSVGFRRARLTVSPTNTRAIAYYTKHSWRTLGPHATEPVNIMEFDLP